LKKSDSIISGGRTTEIGSDEIRRSLASEYLVNGCVKDYKEPFEIVLRQLSFLYKEFVASKALLSLHKNDGDDVSVATEKLVDDMQFNEYL
jgi:hypothetical protein